MRSTGASTVDSSRSSRSGSSMKRAPGIRGQYESFDRNTGLWHVHKNIFTIAGWAQILAAAFQGADFSWEVGLCSATPSPEIDIDTIGEPDSSGGYLRQALVQGETDWPEIGVVENESYVLSKEFTFPSSGEYSVAVRRLFMVDAEDNVISVSSAFPEAILFDEPSLHRYRLYFR